MVSPFRQHYVASDLVLHCLPLTILRVTRDEWLKEGSKVAKGDSFDTI